MVDFMDNKRLLVLGIGIIGFLAMFLLIFVAKQTLESSYKVLLPAEVNLKAPVDPYAEWKQYISDVGHFQAEFPTIPQKASEMVAIPDSEEKGASNLFISQSPNGNALMVKVVRYPKGYKITSMDLFLKKPMTDLANAQNGTIVRDMQNVRMQDFPAIDFTLENGEIHMNGRTIFAYGSLYTLVYVSKEATYDKNLFHHFLDNFFITPDLSVQK